MLRPLPSHPVAAAAMVLALIIAISGCGGQIKTDRQKGESKSDGSQTPASNASTPPTDSLTPSTSVNPDVPLPPSQKIDHNSGVGKAASDFVTSLRNGTVRADQVSTRFAKALGQPALFESDKAKGYSPDGVEAWLKRVGGAHSLSAFLDFKQEGDVALFRGILGDAPGSYALRLAKEGNAWKLDWFSISSAVATGVDLKSLSGEAACRAFTVYSVLCVLCDRDAVSVDDRAVILGAGLTSALKSRWAEPLPSDKASGLDHNRGLLAQKAKDFSKDLEGFSVAAIPNSPDFQVEVSRSNGSKTAYRVKLAPGAGPCLWLVDDVVPK